MIATWHVGMLVLVVEHIRIWALQWKFIPCDLACSVVTFNTWWAMIMVQVTTLGLIYSKGIRSSMTPRVLAHQSSKRGDLPWYMGHLLKIQANLLLGSEVFFLPFICIYVLILYIKKNTNICGFYLLLVELRHQALGRAQLNTRTIKWGEFLEDKGH